MIHFVQLIILSSKLYCIYCTKYRLFILKEGKLAHKNIQEKTYTQELQLEHVSCDAASMIYFVQLLKSKFRLSMTNPIPWNCNSFFVHNIVFSS